MHLHKWSKWEDGRYIATYNWDSDKNPIKKDLTQSKVCSVCGKKKIRKERVF